MKIIIKILILLIRISTIDSGGKVLILCGFSQTYFRFLRGDPTPPASCLLTINVAET